MRPGFAAAVAVMVSLTAAGCTTNDEPTNRTTPASDALSAGAPSSMTLDEAYQRVPMDGVDDLRISWDVPQGQDVDEVLAARRTLAYDYWLSQATDWTPIIPIARFLYTEEYYQQVWAGLETSKSDDPYVGALWVKFMDVEPLGPNQARVTFCADIGWWLQRSWDKTKPRKDRANLESFVMENVQTGDGERRWLADGHLDPDADREAKFGAECTKWAQHQP